MSNQYGLPLRPQQSWPAQPPQYTQPPPGQLPPGYQQPPPGYYLPTYPQQPYQPPPRQAPRKRRRVFMWVFLAIQVLFIAWVVAGAATSTAPPHSQIVSGCYNHHWWPLFKSQADCVTHYGGALHDAGNVGKGLGIAVVVIIWVAVDIILGISYGVYRLATRDHYR